MKINIIPIALISLVVGGIAGFTVAVNVFAINIDVLGIPYKNIPVQTTKDVTIEQGKNKIIIPKGSTVQYGYTAKEQPYYFIEFYGALFGDGDTFKNTNKSDHFFLETEKNKNGS